MPDGTRVPNTGPKSEDAAIKVEGENVENGAENSEEGDGPMTKAQIYAKREAIVDRALISAVKTLTQLARAQEMMAYKNHPRINKTFLDKYNISISFALHVGRAIEGAIGSEFKVDALYLSADTQIALRIDQLCDTYDRQILLSGAFQGMLSSKGKTFCRKVDQVCMEESKGASKEIYCFDLFHIDPLEEEQKPEDDVQNGKFIPSVEYVDQDISAAVRQGIQYVYEYDHDFCCIKRAHKPDFYDFFGKAIDSYIDGDWVNAQSNL